jgi:hypothetical protein
VSRACQHRLAAKRVWSGGKVARARCKVAKDVRVDMA